MGPLGLYVHVPFCQSKCGYCDFYSIARQDRPTLPLVQALLRELELRLAGREPEVSIIFIGGGTPTILPPTELSRLVSPLGELTRRRGQIEEFTVEANPGTVSPEILDELKAAGVDRVSMGAQSFHPAELATLERLHCPADIPVAVETCRRGGIRRLNLDLIFGIPGQTLESWRESLHRAIDLDVDHLSCYGLTYEPGTALTARRDSGALAPCDEDLEGTMYLLAIDLLAEAGYQQYEISNFSRPGQECRHNLNYWQNGPYIGVGPSAAGYLGGARYKNLSGIDSYVRAIEGEGHAVIEEERVEGPALAGETAMLQLRLNQGICFDRFRARTGFDARALFGRSIDRYTPAGFLTYSDERVALTRSGRLIADTIIADFIADADEAATQASKGRRAGTATGRPVQLKISGGGASHSALRTPNSALK